MSHEATEAYTSVKFYRRKSGFNLAILAVLAGIAGILLHFFGPAPRETAEGPAPSLAQICAGFGAGFIWAAVLLNFLWGLTSNGRYFVTFFTSMIVVLPIGIALPPGLGLPTAVVVALAGVALFFFELGLFIEVSTRAIRRGLKFPLKLGREIPWERVDRVFTDLRTVTTHGAGGRLVESENRLTIKGNGAKIAFNTTRFEAVRDDLVTPLDRARPFAVAATLDRLNRDGAVRLGPVELRPDALLVRRFTYRPKNDIPPFVHILATLLTCGLWVIVRVLMAVVKTAKRPLRLPLEKVSQATFEKGNLVIVADRRIYLPLRRVPNGIFFPEILDALQPAAAAPAGR